jgi:hypothetical protein
MTFKICEVPSPNADPVEHADYLELECLRQSDRNASGGGLAAALSRIDDDLPEDRHDADERMEAIVEGAFDELENRSEHSGDGPYKYPFKVDAKDKLLEYFGKGGESELYLYMLLATRMNMQTDRSQGGINGTHLFEEICCEVAKHYWGHRTDGLVFGTARRLGDDEMGGFQQAVSDLCNRMGEGHDYHSHSGHAPTAQDGKLDIVVWKGFTDEREGQLIGFGQCKTGTHWGPGAFQLVPESFCTKWIRTRPAVIPVKLFFMTSRPRNTHWRDTCVDAGIVFDRCRTLDFAPKMATLEVKWTKWTRAALAMNGIAVP